MHPGHGLAAGTCIWLRLWRPEGCLGSVETQVMAPFLPVNDRSIMENSTNIGRLKKISYTIMHVDMMFMFINWYWLRVQEYEVQIISKFNVDSPSLSLSLWIHVYIYIRIIICTYIHDFLWCYCLEHNTLCILKKLYINVCIQMLYIVTTVFSRSLTSALHYWYPRICCRVRRGTSKHRWARTSMRPSLAPGRVERWQWFLLTKRCCPNYHLSN